MSTEERDIKQVIILRTDLNMRKGKMVAQAGHGIVENTIKCISGSTSIWNEWFQTWRNSPHKREKKICVSVKTEEDLINVFDKAVSACLPATIVQDEGCTEFHGQQTLTAVVIGPAPSNMIDLITGTLQLL